MQSSLLVHLTTLEIIWFPWDVDAINNSTRVCILTGCSLVVSFVRLYVVRVLRDPESKE